MTTALILLEASTACSGAVLAGCVLRLQPLTVAMLAPIIAGLVLVGQVVA